MINYLLGQASWLWWAAVAAIDLAAIGLLLYRGHGVERTLAWLFAVIAFPALGGAAYLLLADPTIQRPALRRRRSDSLSRRCPGRPPPGTSAGQLMTLTARTTGLEASDGNHAEVLTSDEAAFARVEECLKTARRSIWAEYYLIRRDETGHRFLDLLAAKARQGIEVRLIYDAIGSFGLNRQRLRELDAAGARCVEFLPVNPLRKRWSVHLRNHRKLIVVDGESAFTGGMNVGDEYSGRARRRGTLHFRDTHLRLAGPCVADLEEVFAADWHFAAGEQLELPEPAPAAAGVARVAIIPSGPDQPRNASHYSYFAGITAARQSIWLTSPYFIPDEATLAALISSALQGVDVRILVPAHSDVLLVGPAGRSFYAQLLAAGARIFEYQPSMLHAKTMVVDDHLALIGSANLDMRSFALNFEVGALIDNHEAAAVLRRCFLEQTAKSREITLDEVRAWPVQRRLAHGAARLFSPLL